MINMGTRIAVFCIATLCGGCEIYGGHPPQEGGRSDASLLQSCERMSLLEFSSYLTHLAENRDAIALETLARSDLPYAGLAAGKLVAVYEPAAAVAYCRQQEIGSTPWVYGFSALGCHPKDGVVDYVKEIAHLAPDASSKYLAYKICMRNRWNELVALAETDLGSTEIIRFPNQPPGRMLLGQVAKEYVDLFRD